MRKKSVYYRLDNSGQSNSEGNNEFKQKLLVFDKPRPYFQILDSSDGYKKLGTSKNAELGRCERNFYAFFYRNLLNFFSYRPLPDSVILSGVCTFFSGVYFSECSIKFNHVKKSWYPRWQHHFQVQKCRVRPMIR